MARKSSICYYHSRNSYYTFYRGRQVKLADGPDCEEQYKAARERFEAIVGGTAPPWGRTAWESGGKQTFLYAVQPVPEFSEGRIKVGITTDPSRRLKSYKTACPSARFVFVGLVSGDALKAEAEAKKGIKRAGGEQVGTEVFDCPDVPAVVQTLGKAAVKA